RNLNFPQSQLEEKFRFLGDRVTTKALLERLAEQNIICLNTRGVALPDRGPRLSQKEAQLLEELTLQYHDAGFRPPSVNDIQTQATHNRQSIPQLIELAEAQGLLIRLSDSLLLHTEIEESLRLRLNKRYGNGAGFTVSELREELEISRKYAVPICEYLDRIGFTRRSGDLRVIIDTEKTPTV
ncbi:MAG: SelB C-terminal domain-containing protein, partial [Pirellulales bacterium]|nr:SelB C-terminal domain-containing protein [Pirellulales bacterium]